ncbi:MAG: hypothetical protein A2847_01915 [Candidatus Sungbacteria bacterium RIFCSPHIGHO2_01_FULL_50_25]|uniref:Probable transcriptional regulatory protein A2847_01915 n=1 Tax=Candidatus Sungbacteria bacterium RIFCSPHIGHO2_01_FULL_50_25 TaxID=1802265 RepID=A0A1G2K8Y8_9BACT|nr:MAG: hypothetical protein A2847_01915 [Candidatus Sungbacteria bacterium RIFCSPHIGHO2_01_FULL_50_25]
MSGHSKWAQIKHKKATTDQKRGILFSKIAREITVAARAGSVDPATNQRLRAAIERARSFGIPKENVERAIERASGAAGAESLHEFLCEALGPKGILVIIEGITDNKNRSLAEIRLVLSRHGARPADPGSILWNFEKRGSFEADLSVTKGPALDDIELAIIDAGATDIKKDDSCWVIESTPSQIEGVRSALASRGIAAKETAFVYHAKTSASPSPESEKMLHDLVEALEGLDDVQNVYTNSNGDTSDL